MRFRHVHTGVSKLILRATVCSGSNLHHSIWTFQCFMSQQVLFDPQKHTHFWKLSAPFHKRPCTRRDICSWRLELHHYRSSTTQKFTKFSIEYFRIELTAYSLQSTIIQINPRMCKLNNMEKYSFWIRNKWKTTGRMKLMRCKSTQRTEKSFSKWWCHSPTYGILILGRKVRKSTVSYYLPEDHQYTRGPYQA